MSNRVALVTGGTGGIGTALCRKMAQMGHRVATNYRDEAKARAWQQEQKAAGFDFTIVAGDVSSAESAAAMVKAVEAALGPVDILVNNAGITHLPMPMEDVPEPEFDRVLAVNAKSVYLTARHLVPAMKARGRGAILNNSPYDLAAAALILGEAGAVVTDAGGAPLGDRPLLGSGAEFQISCVAAANAELHRRICAAVNAGVERLATTLPAASTSRRKRAGIR